MAIGSNSFITKGFKSFVLTKYEATEVDNTLCNKDCNTLPTKIRVYDPGDDKQKLLLLN